MTLAPNGGRLGDVRAVRAAMETDMRAVLLGAAAVLLSEEGPSALTVRRVADAVNASTKMIYTHFGGKDGLFDALYLHSFAGLMRAFEDQCDESD
ncbi:TetR/AcrR family transcriptional regulator [Sphingobium chlorophenolicum]|uniref:Regulatory protein TetR n=1 Tax=Sphingobium chlorophenolicum TaxID=46429 RepID=A0A081RFB4_SPHCR|nr:helix-turn-helix domain-containing protein [Sphingobium chlorophenolicum]KEQ53887.1 Regulatory protein TetR [Sphingobium chlorophenolicum]